MKMEIFKGNAWEEQNDAKCEENITVETGKDKE